MYKFVQLETIGGVNAIDPTKLEKEPTFHLGAFQEDGYNFLVCILGIVTQLKPGTGNVPEIFQYHRYDTVHESSFLEHIIFTILAQDTQTIKSFFRFLGGKSRKKY